MFKNSKLAMTTEKDKYKSNILNNGTYETYNAQVRLLSKNANQRLTLNSGYYPESNNEIFRQLFLSDKVWIEYKEKTLAVNIENNNIDYKTSLTDSLINYTIDVSFAFDTINNIR
jgi:CTP:phosphocholine cytidylyltransferase-like protein